MREAEFQTEFRVNRMQFINLLSKIKDNPIFDREHARQASVEKQLLVTLKRMGCFGNGGSFSCIAGLFGISIGSVHRYTGRCIFAINEIANEVISWPKRSERRQISRRIGESSIFSNCVGFVDGTLFPLNERPLQYGEDYFSRKMGYAINGLVVCDDLKKFRYVKIGWPGSVHDMRVYSHSYLFLNPERYFDPGQYLLADSAYAESPTVIPAIKRSPHQSLSEKERKFNYKHSTKRISVEHCIGMLKGRFQSLKHLRTRLTDEK